MAAQNIKDMKKDIYLMMHKVGEMLELVEDAFAKNRTAQLDQANELFADINKKEDELTAALAKLAQASVEARTLLSVPALVEKTATAVERIVDGIRVKIKEGLLFSDKAIQETSRLISTSKEMLKKAGESVISGTAEAANAVSEESNMVIKMANDFATAHEDRLVTGECSPKSSSTYLCILYAFEDLASYTKDAVRKLVQK